MACDPTIILASLARQLGSGSPCDDVMTDLIPAYWDLTAAEACGHDYLHMLLTKREAIMALMGCEAYSVDTYESHRVLDSRTVGDSQSTTRVQHQATRNATRYAVGHGETRYDETSYARSVGDMDRHGLSTEVGDGISTYRDDGRGNSFNNSAAFNEIDAVDTEVVQDETNSGSVDSGFRTDCNYEYSQNKTAGSGETILIAAGSVAKSASQWRKYAFTRANDSDASTYIRDYARSRDVLDERRGQGTHGWGNFFRADIEWSERDYEVRRGHDRTDTTRHSEAHAQGNGDGLAEDKAETHNASQSTGKSEFQSTATRTLNRVDQTSAFGLSNSQRFTNLRNIYDQLTEQITHAKKRLRGTARSLIATLPCHCNSCCYCLGRSACDILRNRSAYSSAQNGLDRSGILW